jgi:hypothetical protein
VDIDHIVPLANALAVRRKDVERRKAPHLRQRPQRLPADRSERVVEPLDGGPGPRREEAAEAGGMVSVLALVGAGEAALVAEGYSA